MAAAGCEHLQQRNTTLDFRIMPIGCLSTITATHRACPAVFGEHWARGRAKCTARATAGEAQACCMRASGPGAHRRPPQALPRSQAGSARGRALCHGRGHDHGAVGASAGQPRAAGSPLMAPRRPVYDVEQRSGFRYMNGAVLVAAINVKTALIDERKHSIWTSAADLSSKLARSEPCSVLLQGVLHRRTGYCFEEQGRETA